MSFISPACLMLCSHATYKLLLSPFGVLEWLNNLHLEFACLPVLALSSNLAVAQTSGFTTSGWGSQMAVQHV